MSNVASRQNYSNFELVFLFFKSKLFRTFSLYFFLLETVEFLFDLKISFVLSVLVTFKIFDNDNKSCAINVH